MISENCRKLLVFSPINQSVLQFPPKFQTRSEMLGNAP